jgi:hypothetical protein
LIGNDVLFTETFLQLRPDIETFELTSKLLPARRVPETEPDDASVPHGDLMQAITRSVLANIMLNHLWRPEIYYRLAVMLKADLLKSVFIFRSPVRITHYTFFPLVPWRFREDLAVARYEARQQLCIGVRMERDYANSVENLMPHAHLLSRMRKNGPTGTMKRS